jgi:hypothetical protein
LVFWHNWFKKIWSFNRIELNNEKKTIIFQNIFNRSSKTYRFSEIDGSVIMFIPTRTYGRVIRSLYLIKEQKAIKTIADDMYSNQLELEEGLGDINFIGEIKYSYLKSIKIFLGLKILK